MEQLKEQNSLEQFIQDYQRYAIAVNLNRAVPDIRDGLKPVQRNILYAMLDDSSGYSRLVKSSAIVGETMKLYHPHGDSSIYDALVNIANWYSEKIPLIDTKGNFGNMQGAKQAHMRYTEAKLSQFTKECVLGDIKSAKSITDYIPNYDHTTIQPEYLPCLVPLLLIEGTDGIAFGKNVFVPSHNLGEVIDATIGFIKNPNAPVVLIPDECMGSDIVEANWKEICNTGHGSYKTRAIIDVGEDEKKNPCLFIKSVPDGATYIKIEENIIKLAKSSLPQIMDINNLSKGNELNIAIVLRKGSDPYYVKEVLYKKTELQHTNTVNFEAVYGIDQLRLSYKSYIEFFVDMIKTTKFRLYSSRYSYYATRIHEKDFYIKIIESGQIDEFINRVRHNKKDDDEFVEWMIKTYNITDIQAQYAYTIQLNKLSERYLSKYKEDLARYIEEQNKYAVLLTDEKALEEDIIAHLKYIKKKFNTPRKSKVIPAPTAENIIPAGEFLMIVTENNFIKKIQTGQTIGTKDNPKFAMVVDNRDNLLLFSAKGKVFKLPVHKIPLMDKSNNGIDIRIIMKQLTSDIVSIIPESLIKSAAELKPEYRPNIVVMTRENHIKKLDVNDLCSVPPSGIIYSKLSVGESVQSVRLVELNEDVIVYSDRKALRYPMSTIPLYGRMANGVSAMGGKLEYLDGLSVIHNQSTYILVITKSGKINKFPVETLESSDRTKAGSSVIKLSSTDSILSIHGVNESEKLVLVTSNGNVEIPVSEIPVTSSISSGTKMVSGKPIIIKARVEL